MPVSKVGRAAKFMTTGVKVGGNYLKYFSKKAVRGDVSREALDEANAEDIFKSLSQLKGSALKAAQMLSMDQGILPKAYADKFQLAQYSAPPLSYPLVVNTFKKQLGRRPESFFDTFSKRAVNAASIGQVHQATIGEQTFAVKIQYPGVADSVSNDLRIAKPLAAQIMNVKMRELEYYMEEVENKLMEETDYELELNRSVELSEACAHMEGVVFPKYYSDYSSKRIITMDWLEGMHIDQWLETNPSQEDRNRVGQALWDFFDFQIHKLKKVHADPHPGNFLILSDGQLGIIDFGCIKEIPQAFYDEYFQLLRPEVLNDDEGLTVLFEQLGLIRADDSSDEREMFDGIFKEMLSLLMMPIHSKHFDFGDDDYFETIYGLVDGLMRDKKVRKANAARGSRDGIYINRVYFGLYSILHDMRAKIDTTTLANIA